MEKTGDENMILYMIRHGESEANAGGYHSGWGCVHLTEKGRKQAFETGKMVKNLEIDELYASDVLRAQETAEIIFPGRERAFMPMAREINTTPLFGKNKAQLTEIYGDKYLKCREKFNYAPLGIDCESFLHVYARAGQLLKWCEAQGNKRICVVSHAVFMKAVAARVLGIEPNVSNFSCDNACLCAFEYTSGAWKIKKWNVTPMDQGDE